LSNRPRPLVWAGSARLGAGAVRRRAHPRQSRHAPARTPPRRRPVSVRPGGAGKDKATTCEKKTHIP